MSVCLGKTGRASEGPKGGIVGSAHTGLSLGTPASLAAGDRGGIPSESRENGSAKGLADQGRRSGTNALRSIAKPQKEAPRNSMAAPTTAFGHLALPKRAHTRWHSRMSPRLSHSRRFDDFVSLKNGTQAKVT